jgi:transcriptional regulator with XRE-family HTH domain
MTLSQALKQIGWTQAQLAKRLGVTPQTVSGWVTSGDEPAYVSEYVRVLLFAHAILNP